MRLKNTLLTSALISTAALPVNVATESAPEQVAILKPCDRIVVTGRLNTIGDVVATVLCRTDRDGAASFYIVDTSDSGNGGNWRTVADAYKANAEKAEASKNRVTNGAMELSKNQTVLIGSYGTVTVQDFYRDQPGVNDAVTKAAKEKGTYSFRITRQVDASRGDNQRITAFIYKANTRKRIIQSPDAIPVDSDADRAALAVGGETVKKVEILGIVTTTSPGVEVGRFFETQSTKGRRYTTTLPDGTRVEELNKAAVAMIVLFDNIKFTSSYDNMTEVSYQVTKRAAKKDVKYYHITRQWSEHDNSVVISTDLYK